MQNHFHLRFEEYKIIIAFYYTSFCLFCANEHERRICRKCKQVFQSNPKTQCHFDENVDSKFKSKTNWKHEE